jgi:hypothetical protein
MFNKIPRGWLKLLLIPALMLHLHLSFSNGHFESLDLDFNRPALFHVLP